ncbi:MAG TPA: hypothetical protein DIV79_02860 [Opitutae bacterium]|nr:hypothetical protein [Myxococcales bacterium]HCR28940.1 hypothetical protein [Opitutae bacterium]|tara:strand:- start:733 stop:1251 length:519 start_codon:yes stop_codon:yes gene_type:complete
MARILNIIAIFVALSVLTSCATYQLGTPGNSESFKTVYVKPVRNDSTFPMLKATLTASLRKSIQESGFLSNASEGEADTILETRVVSVKRDIAAVSSIDVGRGRKYELEFETLCTLYQSEDGQMKPLFTDRRVIAKQDIFADSGQINAEHQAGPEIARKIARRISESVLDTW